MSPKIDIVYEVEIVPLQVDGDALPISLATDLQMGLHKRSGVSDEINARTNPPGHFSAMMRSLGWLRYQDIINIKVCTPITGQVQNN